MTDLDLVSARQESADPEPAVDLRACLEIGGANHRARNSRPAAVHHRSLEQRGHRQQ
jgi:hypothetical protein